MDKGIVVDTVYATWYTWPGVSEKWRKSPHWSWCASRVVAAKSSEEERVRRAPRCGARLQRGAKALEKRSRLEKARGPKEYTDLMTARKRGGERGWGVVRGGGCVGVGGYGGGGS